MLAIEKKEVDVSNARSDVSMLTFDLWPLVFHNQ